MFDIRAVSWLRHHVSEFRLAVGLVAISVPTTVAGAVLHALSQPGSPEVIIGLSCLTTGVVMLGSRSGRP